MHVCTTSEKARNSNHYQPYTTISREEIIMSIASNLPKAKASIVRSQVVCFCIISCQRSIIIIIIFIRVVAEANREGRQFQVGSPTTTCSNPSCQDYGRYVHSRVPNSRGRSFHGPRRDPEDTSSVVVHFSSSCFGAMCIAVRTVLAYCTEEEWGGVSRTKTTG